VVKWLEEVDLTGLPEIARQRKWSGRVLINLNKVREKDNFYSECNQAGISDSIMGMDLKVELERLFGE